MAHEPKTQHWVPQSYLLDWCDPATPAAHEPYVWVYGKDARRGRNKAPKNLFAEQHMYTLPEPAADRYALEGFLGRVESSFARIRRDKLTPRQPLTPSDKGWLALFIAAMHSRTPAFREHHRAQWQRVLDVAEDMQRGMEQMTPEQREGLRSMSKVASGGGPSMSMDEVRAMARHPIQTMLLPTIKAEARIYPRMTFAVLCTDSSPGFITSDNPVAWFDPEAWRRPPMWRSRGLGCQTIEVTLPISPRQLMVLCWDKTLQSEYLDVPETTVDEANRLTRAHAREHFVVGANIVRDSWFDLGSAPTGAAPAG